MRTTLAGLAWAIAILAVAICASFGLIAKSSASTLLIVLPGLAAASLGLIDCGRGSNGRACS